MTPQSPQIPYTTGDVARLFNVDASTVVRWADAGRIPFFLTPGGQRRYPKRPIDVLASVGAAVI